MKLPYKLGLIMKLDLKIEKSIPIPPNTHRNATVFPFETMEVGDSFLIDSRSIAACRTKICNMRERNPRRFVTRAVVGQKGMAEYRVWRVT